MERRLVPLQQCEQHSVDHAEYPMLGSIKRRDQSAPGIAPEVEHRLAELERRSNSHTKILFSLIEREVLITAGEILKWSVKKQGEQEGEGRQLYDSSPDVQRMVMLGCRAYGEFGSYPSQSNVEAFKALSQIVIKARSDTAHFQNIFALNAIVSSCKEAILEWPELEAKYPIQVKIILKYNDFKRILPECFR